MALSCSWSPSLLTTTQSSSTPKLLPATPEDQQAVDDVGSSLQCPQASLCDSVCCSEIARKLEAVTPIKEPLKSDLLDGKWELLYTTFKSKSILQTGRPKFLRSRVNYQAINVDTLRAQNMESGPTFNQEVERLELRKLQTDPRHSSVTVRGADELTVQWTETAQDTC
ncbi:probable plastid-lipid-associated protein 4, chloroplastic [Argentina anserina]|uniref:probable plastid-lipid-associated protein 4, chloroplastic n=1 Tax=Argentina anserina TaxID=57926 RepID=UPI00217664D8|nr:probable plastid-lipid-associated protein 4, chloroplastic [Potentilla anserina]